MLPLWETQAPSRSAVGRGPVTRTSVLPSATQRSAAAGRGRPGQPRGVSVAMASPDASRGVRLSHARLLFFVIVGENQGSGGEPGAPVSTPSSHPACRGPRSPALPGGRAAGSALCLRRVVCPSVSGEPSLFLQPPPWGAAGRANGPPLPHSPHHAGSLALPRGTCDPDCSPLSSVGADGRRRSHTRPPGPSTAALMVRHVCPRPPCAPRRLHSGPRPSAPTLAAGCVPRGGRGCVWHPEAPLWKPGPRKAPWLTDACALAGCTHEPPRGRRTACGDAPRESWLGRRALPRVGDAAGPEPRPARARLRSEDSPSVRHRPPHTRARGLGL